MDYNEVFFGGEVLPCVVEKFPVIRKAQRKYRTYNIPGRNGDIIVQQDAYENVILPYQIYCGEGENVQTEWDDLAKVLYKDGYQKLHDIADPGHYRMAVFNGPIGADLYWKEVGRTTIEFNCRPERYLVAEANPKDIAATATGISIWNVSDLSNDLQTKINAKVPTEKVYVIEQAATFLQSTIRFLNFIKDGQKRWYTYITPGTETTATGVTMYSTIGNSNVAQFVGTLAHDFIVPVQYFDGFPIVTINNVEVGLADTLENPYMPAYPEIILHAVSSHLSEVVAGRINQYAIYVSEYDSSNPYIFIDAENWNVSKAASLTGERIPASNVRVDAGINLAHGKNSIFTSTNYEMTLSTKFWEL